MAFDLLCEAVGDGDIAVTHYISRNTGLQVVFADVEGPLVHGFMCFATEALDDDGLPHTLEHLVFIGSEDYPYKGVLDLLANKCLSGGTNAWTDTDHTCYTLSTAGEDGFLTLIPIYLDHVLYPILSDDAFITEVHHINGNGEDGGVVYCEMQGRVNTGNSRCELALVRHMYPGVCGYKSETGGMLRELRTSTTNEKCVAFHRKFYRPENLVLIIVGKISKEETFKCLAKFETKILEKRKKYGNVVPFERPWQSAVPPLRDTCKEVVQYPTDDDDNGLVFVGWRGPSAVSEYETILVINVLLEYLTESAVSPLRRDFVEVLDPYCSDVEQCLVENSISYFSLRFQSVPKDKLRLIEAKLFDLLEKIATGKEAIDEKRMTTIIRRKKLHILSQAETSPQFLIAGSVIGYFLYGKDANDLKRRIETIPFIESLLAKTTDFWIEIIRKYMLNSKYVLIIGEPSPQLLKQMTEEEVNRLEAQRKKLGVEGLKEKENQLKAALKYKEPPVELLKKVPIPSIEKIHFHSVERKNNYVESTVDGDGALKLKRIPYRLQLDDLKTNFITFRVLLNTSQCIDPMLRLYIPLWSEIVLESAILRGGVVIPYEQVVTQLAEDTIHSAALVGIDGSSSFAQLLQLTLKIEVEKYSRGVIWLKELLYETKFTVERLKVVVKRMLNDIAQEKREAYAVCSHLIKSICFSSESNHWATNLFRQQKFLTNALKQLDTSPETVVKKMEELREKITSLENLTVHVSMNTNKLKSVASSDLVSPLAHDFVPGMFANVVSRSSDLKLTYCHQLMKKIGDYSGVISALGSTDSSYMLQLVPSLHRYTDPELPALMVLIEYLTQGPLYKDVRGKGLAYGCSLVLKVNQGLLYLELYKSFDVIGGYKESRDVILKHVSGEVEWNESMFDACRSSLIFCLIRREGNVASVSLESLISYLKQVDETYKKELIKRISTVSLEDIKQIASKYLSPLFDPNLSRCAITCNPSKLTEIVEAFKGLHRQLKIVDLEKDDELFRVTSS